MLRFYLKILILAVMTALTVFFFSRFDNDLRSETNQNIIRVKDAAHHSGLDYLFLGSSYTYSGIIPAIFDSAGYKTYNLGISTAGPFFIECVADDYLAHTSAFPENLVIDISPLTFSRKSDNWITYPIHRYLNSPVSNEAVILKYGNEASWALMVQKSFSKGVSNALRRALYLSKGLKYQDVLDPGTSHYRNTVAAKGYEKDCGRFDSIAAKKERPLFKAFLKEKFDAGKADYLARLIRKYTQKGMRVILIRIPTHCLDDYFNSDYLKRYDEFCSMTAKMDNVILIDFKELNDRLGNDCFRNTDHLNCFGADKFTHVLLHRLNTLNPH